MAKKNSGDPLEHYQNRPKKPNDPTHPPPTQNRLIYISIDSSRRQDSKYIIYIGIDTCRQKVMILDASWCIFHIFRMFPIILSPSAVVSLSSRRPTDPNTLAALAAAEQRRQQLHSTREDRQARAWERTRVQHSAQHSRATVWQ